MSLLLAESNSYLTAFITFMVVMSIVGFFVMRADKKRWNRQVARSEQMESGRKKKKKDGKDETAESAENTEAAKDAAVEEKPVKEKKKKKEKKIPEGFVDGRNVKSDAYEYKGLIADPILFGIAIFFGALGELIAMIVYKHRWYKWSYRAFIPACVALNVLVGVLLCLLITAKGEGGILSN